MKLFSQPEIDEDIVFTSICLWYIWNACPRLFSKFLMLEVDTFTKSLTCLVYRSLITGLSKADFFLCWLLLMPLNLLVNGWPGCTRMSVKDCKTVISQHCLRLMHALQGWSPWLLLPLLWVWITMWLPLSKVSLYMFLLHVCWAMAYGHACSNSNICIKFPALSLIFCGHTQNI